VFSILKEMAHEQIVEKALEVLNDQRLKKHVDRQLNLWPYRTRSQCRYSLNVIWEINSGSIRYTGHVALMQGGGEKNSYKCWIENPQCFGVYVGRRIILKLILIYKTKQMHI
jgi:hypothetical protein